MYLMVIYLCKIYNMLTRSYIVQGIIRLYKITMYSAIIYISIFYCDV